MLVSVFTPSHKPDWLRDCWDCLLAQTYQNWEWLVVPNGPNSDAVEATLREITGGDLRAVVVHGQTDVSTIGALKRAACEKAAGDVFLEYDHDDLLTRDCLETLVETLGRSPPASFVFSDGVSCDFQNRCRLFDKANGWSHYDWDYDGVRYQVNRHHPINARSLCEILYAPDHIRAWTRTAYQISGGHNRDMAVADDHDLLVRTYLKGIHFAHISRPLYIHRIDGANTSDVRVNEIQALSGMIRDRNLAGLVAEWCRRENLPMLDMGGAHNCPRGFIPVDRDESVLLHPKGVNYDVVNGAILHKMRKSSHVQMLPARQPDTYYTPGSVGCIRCSDFLEHVPGPQIPTLMNYFYDLLAPGGWLLTHTPAIADDDGRVGRGAWQDPTHVSGWSSNNFWYLINKEFAKYIPEYYGRFQSVRLVNYYPSEWHKTHLIPYVDCDMMKLVEGEYQPGLKYI